MEGGTDNDLLSLDQTFSSENGDKAGEGGEEKKAKDKNSGSKNLHTCMLLPHSLELYMLWMVLLCILCG